MTDSRVAVSAKPRVMIVKANRDVALELKQCVQNLGYETVAIVASGETALNEIKRLRPDVVLIDLDIEGDIDGIETAKLIPADCPTAVIFLTTHSDRPALVRARGTTPYGSIVKPFTAHELDATVQMVLERRRADTGLEQSERRLEQLVARRGDALQAAKTHLRKSIPTSLYLGFILAALSMLVVLGLQVYIAGIRSSNDAASSAMGFHTFQVINAAQTLERSIQDSQLAQRNYLITGEATHLGRYQSAAVSIPIAFATLKQMTADNPEHQRRWALLDELIKIRISTLDRSLAAYEAEGLAAAQVAVRTGVGIDAMREIDALLDAAIVTENNVLIGVNARVANSVRATIQMTYITGAFGLLAMILGIAVALSSFRRVMHAESQLEATKDQSIAAQRLEALGYLTGGIAHDFNNLMQNIALTLSALQRKILQGKMEDVDNIIARTQKSIESGGAMIQRLLAFAQRQPLVAKTVLCGQAITGMKDMLKLAVGELTQIEIIDSGSQWLTQCDLDQLEAAILNITINARDAMPQGGTLTIETHDINLDADDAVRHVGLSPGEYVCITLKDTGMGMSSEVLARAFDPFFTTKPMGLGTGLGLPMVYGFARQSKGHATLASERGRGTTITLYLPRVYDDSGITALKTGAMLEDALAHA